MKRPSRSQTVLVIDDDAIVRLMASEALSDAGYHVVEAPDAESGWQQFIRSGADLVLFPELAVSGYPPEDLLLRPSFLAECEAAIRRIAATTRGIVAVVGWPEAAGAGASAFSALWPQAAKTKTETISAAKVWRFMVVPFLPCREKYCCRKA